MVIIKKILTVLFLIIFPIGLIYTAIHTIGKSPITFIGSVVLVVLGIIAGAYFIPAEQVINIINGALNWIINIF